MESDHISVFIKPEIRSRAKAAGVNMSQVSRTAIIEATEQLEKKKNDGGSGSNKAPDVNRTTDVCEVNG